MGVEQTCIEAGKLLREYFSEAGYFNDHPQVIFYAKIMDDEPTFATVSFDIDELVGYNQHEVLTKILKFWL